MGEGWRKKDGELGGKDKKWEPNYRGEKENSKELKSRGKSQKRKGNYYKIGRKEGKRKNAIVGIWQQGWHHGKRFESHRRQWIIS